MASIATNDVFKDICVLLRIHNDKPLIMELLKSKGWDVSRAKIKAWSTRSGGYNKDYRPMPEAALRDFIDALKTRKLIEVEDGE